MAGAWREFRAAVAADHQAIHATADKYGGATQAGGLLGDMVQKVGFQLLVAYRVMRFFDRAGAPFLARVTCRAIRHLYGADIHWKADLEPGVLVVHGMGLCINAAVRVGAGCILFQNVTLGEGIDPVTRDVGAPCLEPAVHVGPGATLVGPITIGSGSKIMAGCVVTCSVPPRSLVEAPSPQIRPREKAGAAGGPS